MIEQPEPDDRPFVAQMGMWKNFEWSKLEKVSKYSDFRGFPLSKSMIAIILLVTLLVLVPINLIYGGAKLESCTPALILCHRYRLHNGRGHLDLEVRTVYWCVDL